MAAQDRLVGNHRRYASPLSLRAVARRLLCFGFRAALSERRMWKMKMPGPRPTRRWEQATAGYDRLVMTMITVVITRITATFISRSP